VFLHRMPIFPAQEPLECLYNSVMKESGRDAIFSVTFKSSKSVNLSSIPSLDIDKVYIYMRSMI